MPGPGAYRVIKATCGDEPHMAPRDFAGFNPRRGLHSSFSPAGRPGYDGCQGGIPAPNRDRVGEAARLTGRTRCGQQGGAAARRFFSPIFGGIPCRPV